MIIDCLQPGDKGYAIDTRLDIRHVVVKDVSIFLKKMDDDIVQTIHYNLETLDNQNQEERIMYPMDSGVYLTIEEAEAEKLRRIEIFRSYSK
jgi:hypothetical protein